jgi:hypothetical protein
MVIGTIGTAGRYVDRPESNDRLMIKQKINTIEKCILHHYRQTLNHFSNSHEDSGTGNTLRLHDNDQPVNAV